MADAGSPTLVRDGADRERALRADADAGVTAPPAISRPVCACDSMPGRPHTGASAGRSAGRAPAARLTDFRNYRQLRARLRPPSPVVLAGANGAGKTNLLEALSFLAPGRGLRRATPRRGRPPRRAGETADAAAWAVAAHARYAGRARSTSAPACEPASARAAAAAGGAHRRPAGARARPRLAGMSRPCLADAADGPAVPRRRRRAPALPRPAGVRRFDPGACRRVAAYEHALRERARLLREGGRDPPWLTALEDTMADTAWPWPPRGADTVAAPRRRARGWASARSRAPRWRMAGAVEAGSPTMPALAAEDRLRAALAAGRLRDAEAGAHSWGRTAATSRCAIVDATCRRPRARPASRRRC